MNEEITQIRNKYCSQALISAIVIAAVCIVIGQKPIAKGLILGTLFSILNFIAMAYTLPMRLGHAKRKTFWVGFGGIWFRYLLMGIPILIAIRWSAVNFFATAAGLFMVQGVILVHHGGKMIFRKNKANESS